MTSVAVVVGHSRNDDAHRLANLAWVVARYQAHDYPVAVGAAASTPWVKAHAFNPTAATVDADVLVIADADCIVTRGALAATVTAAARDGYAVPAKAVHRLTPEATSAVLGRMPGDDIAERLPCEGKHQLLAGGGIVAIARDLWHEVRGFDPRFVGWGGEDFALGCALYGLTGHYPRRQHGVLWHLWHPPQGRNQRLTPDNERLSNRYRSVKFDRAAMRALINEREDPWPPQPDLTPAPPTESARSTPASTPPPTTTPAAPRPRRKAPRPARDRKVGPAHGAV